MESDDMRGLTAELNAAGEALEAFAAGPARQAADALEAAFGRAGRSIRNELESAARSGEADFERLGRTIAEVLAQAVVRQMSGGGGGGAPVNVTMNVSGGGAPSGRGAASASANQIAALVARAAARGARFS